jgi:hypothetical protein
MNEAWFYFYPNWQWNNARAGYFLQLFNAGYNAMHAEDSQVRIGNDAALYRRFLEYWKDNGGQLDLLTFHKYDSWGLGYDDDQGLDSAERKHFDPSYDSLHLTIAEARQLWGANLPAINSESNWGATYSGGTDPRIQQLCGTVWTALMLRGSILHGVNYAIYYEFSCSKDWETSHSSQGYGFGMINHDNNQPWYPYYVHQLVGTNLAVGDSIVSTTSASNDIKTLAWIHQNQVNLLIICREDQQKTVRVTGLQGPLAVSKIDNTISWENPSVQTSSMNPNDPVTMDGYAVLFIQST